MASTMTASDSSNHSLHLPDLSIRGFRGIKTLTLSTMGRVTLFAGKNGSGKTTILDAVRVYASRGRLAVLMDILRSREEVVDTVDEEGSDTTVPNWPALFFGRVLSTGVSISIGAASYSAPVKITPSRTPRQADFFDPGPLVEDSWNALEVEYRDAVQRYQTSPVGIRRQHGRFLDERPFLPPAIECESLGPSLPNNSDMARFWDRVALTSDESRALSALNLIYKNGVERVAMVGDDSQGFRLPRSRRAVVKLEGEDRPAPLKSLGDGAVRLFGIALALANSRDGFLLIDEVENGIHHTIQRDLWTMVLKAAQENNVQVLATTHSWDCLTGFAQAAVESHEVNGALVRIERDGDDVRAVEYSEHDLRIAAEQGIEVR